MKKNIAVFAVMVAFQVKAQEFKSAVDYLNYVTKIETPITKEGWKYTKTVAHSKSARRIENVRKNLIKTIQTAKNNLAKNKKGYNGDLEFHNKVIDYLSFMENSYNNDYAKIVDMQEISEQSYDLMEAYINLREKVNEKIDEEHQKLILAQNEFAKKYNVNIVDNGESSKMEKNIKISNQVFKYHSDLYLVFFKCNYIDILLSQAVQKSDVAAIQQNANTLIQYADEGIEKLKTSTPIKGDMSLANATKKCLEMYKKEAQEFAPKTIEFLTYNSKFEETKASLERKSQKERTKEEVDNYNKMVKEINKKIADFNKLNTNNVNIKNKEITNWNHAGESYISKHIPND